VVVTLKVETDGRARASAAFGRTARGRSSVPGLCALVDCGVASLYWMGSMSSLRKITLSDVVVRLTSSLKVRARLTSECANFLSLRDVLGCDLQVSHEVYAAILNRHAQRSGLVPTKVRP
jgi:hypothetical protein